MMCYNSVGEDGKPTCFVPVKHWFEIYFEILIINNIAVIILLTRRDHKSYGVVTFLFVIIQYYWIIYGFRMWRNDKNDCDSSKDEGSVFLNTIMMLIFIFTLYLPFFCCACWIGCIFTFVFCTAIRNRA